MVFYVAQILGGLTTVLVAVQSQLKSMKQLLFTGLLINLLVAISTWMLGGLSGAWVGIVASAQTVIMYIAERKECKPKTRAMLLLFFAVMYLIGTIAVYRDWKDLVALAGAFLYLGAIVQTKPKWFRRFTLLKALVWVAYDIRILSFGTLITHGVEAISYIAAIIRLDIKKTVKAE